MIKYRVPETDHGIVGETTVQEYDAMQRNLRDHGWIATQEIIRGGITAGHSLEVGHGPGYLGLEWLKQTHGTRLTGLDISTDMTRLAQTNAAQYGLTERTTYRNGNADHLPFADATFDHVFTNGSLHEWAHPLLVFNEIERVLKPGGRFFISDLRRDMNWFMQTLLWSSTKPASIRPWLRTSIDAAYTPGELMVLAAQSALKDARLEAGAIDVALMGVKTG